MLIVKDRVPCPQGQEQDAMSASPLLLSIVQMVLAMRERWKIVIIETVTLESTTTSFTGNVIMYKI